jgi:O-antigen/teichoic acid export membrane protein
MLTATLATLGVEEANGNLGASRPALRPSLATNSLLLSALLGSVASGLLIVIIAMFPAVGGGSSQMLLAVAVAVVPVIVLQMALLFLIRADYRFAFANVVALVPPVGTVVVNGTLAAVGAISVAAAFSVWTVGQLASTTLLLWYVSRRFSGFGRPDPLLARRALTFGAQAHTGRVMKTGNYRLDQWLLGSIAGPRELGLYSVAVAWSEALFVLPSALRNVQRPDLVRAARREAGRQAALVFRICVAITLPAVVVMVLIAPFLCTTVFGDEFSEAVDDLRWLAPGAFGIIAIRLLGDALIAQRRPLLPTIAVGVALIVTIVLDIVLIPAYGGEGAAIASLASYTVGGVVVAALFVRGLSVSPGELVARPRDLPAFVGSLRAKLGTKAAS